MLVPEVETDLAALLAVGIAKPPILLFSTPFGPTSPPGGGTLALTCNFANAADNPYKLPFTSEPNPSRRVGRGRLVSLEDVASTAVEPAKASVRSDMVRATRRGIAAADVDADDPDDAPGPSVLGWICFRMGKLDVMGFAVNELMVEGIGRFKVVGGAGRGADVIGTTDDVEAIMLGPSRSGSSIFACSASCSGRSIWTSISSSRASTSPISTSIPSTSVPPTSSTSTSFFPTNTPLLPPNTFVGLSEILRFFSLCRRSGVTVFGTTLLPPPDLPAASSTNVLILERLGVRTNSECIGPDRPGVVGVEGPFDGRFRFTGPAALEDDDDEGPAFGGVFTANVFFHKADF